MGKKESTRTFRRHPLFRTLNFLLLLPFIPAGLVLRESYTTAQMILFSVGLALILTLIMLNNQRPVITMEADRLVLHLLYSHKPEFHPFNMILGYKIKGKRRLKLFSLEHAPVKLYMRKSERQHLIRMLTLKEIYEVQ